MLSLKEIRNHIELVKKAISAKNIEFDLDKLLLNDEKRRKIIQDVENLKSERNAINKKIASKEDVDKNIDLMAEDVRVSIKEFGKLFGNVDIEDILDIIFSDFCIGK